MTDLRLYLFGTGRVQTADGPVTGKAATPLHLAFLALVGTAAGGVTRDRLVAYLWPEHRGGRHLLSDALHHLRSALGADALRTSGQTVWLDRSRVSCDVAEFREARREDDWRRMITLYEGPFMAGFHGAGGIEFERWMEDERTRCREVATEAVHRLAESLEATGDLTGALEVLHRGRVMDPYNELLARRTMALHLRVGDRGGAMRVYRMLEQRLRRDLEIGPSELTRSVIEAAAAN